MNIQLLKEAIAGVDIYIIDQILKNNYKAGAKILDAGCGNGRNLKWFYNTDFEIHGTDLDTTKIEYCKELYEHQKENFIISSVEKLPYKANSFDYIICNAVLHFAENSAHFHQMFNELVRILKPNGMLFIRMASNFGIETEIKHLKNGVYKLPDNSTRFLLTNELLDELKRMQTFSFIEAIKTTIVEHKRSMTTLVLQKEL